jgi:hypothetical protein
MGGSQRAGESPLECIARKCFEKAFLPLEYTRAKIRACSVLRYQMTRTDEGKKVCQDQVQCLYEMQMGKDSLLVAGNGEAHESDLWRSKKLLVLCGRRSLGMIVV